MSERDEKGFHLNFFSVCCIILCDVSVFRLTPKWPSRGEHIQRLVIFSLAYKKKSLFLATS